VTQDRNRPQRGRAPSSATPHEIHSYRVILYVRASVASGSEVHAIAQTPRASLVASVWECRRHLMLYQATQQNAAAVVLDESGEVVWQGHCDRGDLHLQASSPQALQRIKQGHPGGAA